MISPESIQTLTSFLSKAGIAFDRSSFTGVIVYISQGSNDELAAVLTCVAETHLHADDLFSRVETILLDALAQSASSHNADEAVEFDHVAGITLLAPRAPPAADRSLAPGSDSAPEVPDSAPEVPAAETCCGMSLFRDPGAPPVDWCAAALDSAAGVTLLSRRPPAPDPPSPPPPGPAAPWRPAPAAAGAPAPERPLASLAWEVLRGWLQDPEAYTEDQARLSDLAWGV